MRAAGKKFAAQAAPWLPPSGRVWEGVTPSQAFFRLSPEAPYAFIRFFTDFTNRPNALSFLRLSREDIP